MPEVTIESTTGEVVAESRELIPQTVRSLITPDQAKAEWEDYIRLCQMLLDPTDYQKIGRKLFKKKSAWRKLAKVFAISDRIVREDVHRDERGWPVFAFFEVEAEHKPTGRMSIGYHEAHLNERCCPTAWGRACDKARWEGHTCCIRGCDGWLHWSHPGDIPATAHTRAKNRAIADLIGAGEVSAEEMDTPPKAMAPVRKASAQGAPPQTWNEFWAVIQGTLGLDREKVHAMFGLSPGDGELKGYAEGRASRESKSLAQVVAEMLGEVRQRLVNAADGAVAGAGDALASEGQVSPPLDQAPDATDDNPLAETAQEQAARQAEMLPPAPKDKTHA